MIATPALSTVISLLSPVIPAKAGIQRAASASGEMDSRLRGNDGIILMTEANELLGISLEGRVR